MHVQRVQFQSRMAWPSLPSGYYFWTNQFYYNLDDAPDDNSSLYWAANFMLEASTEAVELNWLRVLDPPHTDTVLFSGSAFNQPGNYPIETGYSPFDTVLMRWLIGGRQVGYSRLRLPVQAGDQVDGMLHPDLASFLSALASTNLVHGKMTSGGGVPIDEFRIDPRVRMWQFRHGTERRERIIVPNT